MRAGEGVTITPGEAVTRPIWPIPTIPTDPVKRARYYKLLGAAKKAKSDKQARHLRLLASQLLEVAEPQSDSLPDKRDDAGAILQSSLDLTPLAVEQHDAREPRTLQVSVRTTGGLPAGGKECATMSADKLCASLGSDWEYTLWAHNRFQELLAQAEKNRGIYAAGA